MEASLDTAHDIEWPESIVDPSRVCPLHCFEVGGDKWVSTQSDNMPTHSSYVASRSGGAGLMGCSNFFKVGWSRSSTPAVVAQKGDQGLGLRSNRYEALCALRLRSIPLSCSAPTVGAVLVRICKMQAVALGDVWQS